MKKEKVKREYTQAEGVSDMARELVSKYAGSNLALDVLQETRIEYLFLSGIEHNKWRGKCCRTTGHWHYLTDFDYVIVLWKEWWDEASELQRNALLYHELSHIIFSENKEHEIVYGLRDHELEIFVSEVRAYGLWDESLDYLDRVIQDIKQDEIDSATVARAMDEVVDE